MSASPARDDARPNPEPATNGANDLAAENAQLRQQLDSLTAQLAAERERARHLEGLLEVALPTLIEKGEWHSFKDLVVELEGRLLPK